MAQTEIKGFLETVRPEWVSGWAYDVANEAPVEVKLWINDEVKSTMVADEERERMRELKIHPTGQCGFMFRLDQLGIKLPDHCVIRVTAGEDNAEIWQSPWPYWSESVKPKGNKSNGQQNDQLGDQFFFIHIPKTAGSSFGDMLLNVFQEDQIYANQHDKKNNNTFFPSHNDYLMLSEEKRESIRLLVGHVPYAIGDILPRKVHRMVFLREPRERVISHLAFAHQRFPLVKGQSIKQLFHQVKIQQLTNSQVVYFADNNPYDLRYFKRQSPLNASALRQAIENLNNCAFVGIMEEFKTSIKLIEKMFGWDLGTIPFKNKSSSRYKMRIPQDVLDELDEITQLDQIIYKAAKERFQFLKESFL